MYLMSLRVDEPPYLKTQTVALEWLARAYTRASIDPTLENPSADGSAPKDIEYKKLLDRVACRPPAIETRAHYSQAFHGTGDAGLFPELDGDPGATTPLRMQIFEREARKMIEGLYAGQSELAAQLLHVTCTGYVAPSPAESFVLAQGAARSTVVTHLYHMGCYASIPALRMAQGLIQQGQDVDVVHTELCTLHLQPRKPSLERMVIESLFADGGAAYRLTAIEPTEAHFKIVSLRQELLPDTADLMAWVISDYGMEMRLNKEVPRAIHGALRDFQQRWLQDLGLSVQEFSDSSFAVHPGGPRIIDQVKDSLELSEESVRHSRAVLRDRGNMSSATLPHIWKRLLDDPQIPAGGRVFSYAFGPGLTVAAVLLEKRVAAGDLSLSPQGFKR